MKKQTTESLLQIVDVASPCSASWEMMEGDDRQRHCSQCNLNVFNLSDMNAEEAEEFLQASMGQSRTCVRFYRRADGTVLTQDCPVGLQKARQRLMRAGLKMLAACFAFLCSGIALAAAGTKLGKWAEDKGEYARLGNPAEQEIMLGSLCIPAPPVTTPNISAGDLELLLGDQEPAEGL